MRDSKSDCLALLGCVWLVVSGCPGYAQENALTSTRPEAVSPANPIADLMLIYDGGQGRQPWTAE